MKKLLLASTITSLLLSPYVMADWKVSLNESLDKAKSYVTSDEPEIHMTTTEEAISQHWDSVEKRFGKVMELKEKQDAAPHKSGIIKKGKSDYQEAIDDLLGQVFELISDDDLTDYQEQLRKNVSVRKEKISELSDLKRKYKLSFDAGDKEDLANDIVKQEQEVAYVDEQKSLIIIAVKERLNDFGTHVTDDQVESLLLKANADDILSMTSVFPIISEFANYLGQVTQDTGEDLIAAKKYYGMYVLLLELQLFIQDQYITKLDKEYVPELNSLRADNLKLISETKRLSRNTTKRNVEIYKKNLESQQFTLQAINLYKKQLVSDSNKIKQARTRLKRDYDAAINTYKTVSLSFNVSELIKNNSQLFDEVMSLQAPNLIPFENEKMKEEFAKLTAKIES